MKKITMLFLFTTLYAVVVIAQSKFVSIKGKNIVGTDGKPFIMKGTNLGNWLVPEGYMFKFKNTNSPAMISETISQLIGPAEAAKFWTKFLDNYITQKDIHFIKSIGANSIRIPFNYRLFTNENYLGANDSTRGFVLLDKVINWCKKEKLFVILDMHCAPGGQTGDNIDDGFGYPFLFESPDCQSQTIDIWHRIAKRYSSEPIVIGYDLLNEPIAHYFDTALLNPLLEPLYKAIVKEIRKVDKNHLVFLGGAQWDTNFQIFGEPFDSKVVYTFHKYWEEPTPGSIERFIAFREKYNVPIYLGESGENTDEWIEKFRKLLEANDIGWHFWPYKKMNSPSNIVSITMPTYFDSVIAYAETPRIKFEDIRKASPKNKEQIKQALDGFLNNCRFTLCQPNTGYINALGFNLKKNDL